MLPPPPFNLIPVVLNKVIQDNADLVLVAPIWQAQPRWPILLSRLVSNPVLLPHSPRLMRGRSKQGTSDVPSPSSDRVSNLQQYYQTEGFPGQVTKLLLSATRSSTRKAYQSAWSRWSRWCAKGNLSCFSPTLKNSWVLSKCFFRWFDVPVHKCVAFSYFFYTFQDRQLPCWPTSSCHQAHEGYTELPPTKATVRIYFGCQENDNTPCLLGK